MSDWRPLPEKCAKVKFKIIFLAYVVFEKVGYIILLYSCFAVHLPITETKGRDEITIITVSVILSASVTITIVVIISGTICFTLVRKKLNQKGNQGSKEKFTDTDGPLQFENELQEKIKLEASGTKTLVAENEGKLIN